MRRVGWIGCGVVLLAGVAGSQGRPVVVANAPHGNAAMYRDDWIDFNKNDRKDVFEDPAAPLDRRLDDLLAQMTIEEKTCQLATLYGFNRVLKDPLPTPAWKSEIWKDGIGNIDAHANGVRGAGTQYATPPSRHAEVINTVQRFFVEETRLGIPVDFTNEGNLLPLTKSLRREFRGADRQFVSRRPSDGPVRNREIGGRSSGEGCRDEAVSR